MKTHKLHTQLNKPIVSVDWLHANLLTDTIVILNATITKVTDANTSQNKLQIPNARFFDLKGKFSDTNALFPTTIPSEKQFAKEAQKLGIDANSTIVVYDNKGIYSSARVWWLFKVFGYTNVVVLDGGLPEWTKAGYKTEPYSVKDLKPGDFVAKYQPNMMKYFIDIKMAIDNSKYTIIDARSEKRFKSLVTEPRKGLRSGNIPNSINLPYESLLHDRKLKSKEELKMVFKEISKKDSKFIVYCGSGITACIVVLAAEVCNYNNSSVYDGSWTEYGTLVSN